MANKYNKGVSGSVQEKRGMLYLVVSFKDPITQRQLFRSASVCIKTAPFINHHNRGEATDNRQPSPDSI